jgi:hypothetical protein
MVNNISKYEVSQPFFGCENLTSISVSPDNPIFFTIDDVLLQNTTYTDGTTGISLLGYPAGKPDTTYSIPDGTTQIICGAFYLCDKLTDIYIPASVSGINAGIGRIHISAFQGCTSLQNFGVDSANKYYGSIDGVLYWDSLGKGDLHSIEAYPLGRKDSAFTIPDGIDTIGSHSFAENKALKTAALPKGIRVVSGYAFQNCTSLTDIVFQELTHEEDSLRLDSYAFVGCTRLRSVTFDESINFYDKLQQTWISKYAFSYSDNLTIYAKAGSYAETYANENNIPFVAGVAPPISDIPYKDINVSFDGEFLYVRGGAPYIDENGRTMVPLRMVEGLNQKIDLFNAGLSVNRGGQDSISVEWVSDTQTVVIRNYIFYKTYDYTSEYGAFTFENTLGFYVYELKIGSNQINVKHTPMVAGPSPTELPPIVMDTVAVLKGGRTYIPLRYIAEALGLTVEWDSATRIAALTPEE